MSRWKLGTARHASLSVRNRRFPFMTIDSGQDAASPSKRMLVTATIYRDDAQVSSMIQQGVEVGLASETKRASSAAGKVVHQEETTTGGGASAGVDLPALINLGGKFDRSSSHGLTDENGSGHSGETTFAHTAAGHLHHVLTALAGSDLIRPVSRLRDARDVQVGDFVEFKATFRPNELATILDVITPNVAGDIARQIKRSESLSQMDAVEYEDFKGWVEKRKYREDSAADLTRLLVRAIQADLRSDQTREYHAQVEGSRSTLTAVVACEATSFVTADPDRLLDGNFTVVGKVISPARKDVSVFARSKLLARIQPEAVDIIHGLLEGIMGEQTTDFAGNDATLGDVIDLTFPSRIGGLSFGVLPIVIYV